MPGQPDGGHHAFCYTFLPQLTVLLSSLIHFACDNTICESTHGPTSLACPVGDSRKGAVLEVQRLQTTAAALRKAVLQGVAPDQGTTGFGTLVHDWLKLRLDAIAEEIGRLQNLFGTQPESRAGLL